MVKCPLPHLLQTKKERRSPPLKEPNNGHQLFLMIFVTCERTSHPLCCTVLLLFPVVSTGTKKNSETVTNKTEDSGGNSLRSQKFCWAKNSPGNRCVFHRSVWIKRSPTSHLAFSALKQQRHEGRRCACLWFWCMRSLPRKWMMPSICDHFTECPNESVVCCITLWARQPFHALAEESGIALLRPLATNVEIYARLQ